MTRYRDDALQRWLIPEAHSRDLLFVAGIFTLINKTFFLLNRSRYFNTMLCQDAVLRMHPRSIICLWWYDCCGIFAWGRKLLRIKSMTPLTLPYQFITCISDFLHPIKCCRQEVPELKVTKHDSNISSW